MRKFLIGTALACALALLAFWQASADPSSSTASNSDLTGNMSPMQALVGSWNCTVNIAAMQGQPAFTDHGIVTYSVVPGNALHSHVTAKDYASDYYSGYDDKGKIYWMNTIDAYANSSTETSSDGKVFSGSTAGGDGKKQVRDTLSRPETNKIRDLQEYQVNGAWKTASDSTCTRI